LSAQIEAEFIASLRTVDDINYALGVGVRDDLFANFIPVWQWILRYHGTTAQAPSIGLIQTQFPTFDPPLVVGDVRHHALQLREAYISRRAREVMFKEADSGAIDTQPVDAVERIIRELSGLRIADDTALTFLDGDALKLLQEVEQRSAANASRPEDVFVGLRTGIEVIDCMRMGWRQGMFGAIIAQPGVGKTEFLIRTAAEAWGTGHPVLFISLEMSEAEIGMRAIPILGHQLGYGVPSNTDLMMGTASPKQMADFRALVENDMAVRHDWAVVDQIGQGSFSLQDVRARVRELKPALVVIDGIKLLKAEGESKWAQYSNNIEGCKVLAMQEKVAVIGAEHAGRNQKDVHTPPTLQDVYMGDSIGQWADAVATIAVPKMNSAVTRLFSLQKNRGGVTISRQKTISFDIDRGDVGRWLDPVDQRLKSELARYLDAGGMVPSGPGAIPAPTASVIVGAATSAPPPAPPASHDPGTRRGLSLE